MTMDVRSIAQNAARTAYGRTMAFLARFTRDLASAEDAMGEALLNALDQWPREGVPDNPDAWLLTAARRRLIDASRRDARARALHEALARSLGAEDLAGAGAQNDRRGPMRDADAIPDERLSLLFACAHPALDRSVRPALMLQALLGLSVEQMAPAFVLPPATLAQRLVRAKSKIRDAHIELRVPDANQMPERLDDVLGAVYAAFSTAWDDHHIADRSQVRSRDRTNVRTPLQEDAILLARLMVKFLPDEPEALGLLALLLHVHARDDARRDARGRYVPLDQQDPLLWDLASVREGEGLLRRAFELGRTGRFQLEAAIQSAHNARAFTGEVDLGAVLALYAELNRTHPTIGSLVAQAAATLATRTRQCAGDALSQLDALNDRAGGDVQSYQAYWAVRAEALRALGETEAAIAARARAVALTDDPSVRDYLLRDASTRGDDDPAPDRP